MQNEVKIANVPVRTPRKVLIVHPECNLANSLSADTGEVRWVASGKEALEVLRLSDFPAILYHESLSQSDGFHLMDLYEPQAPVAFLILADNPTTTSAIDALRHRAIDYLSSDTPPSEITRRIDRALTIIETARLHEDMISMVTHDIKVPLSSILGYCPLVFDKDTGNPHPRGPEFVQIIRSNANKILTLVDNYLTGCKIDATGFDVFFRPIQTDFLVQDILSTFDCEWSQNELNFTSSIASPLPEILGDEALLFRALGNMFGNAAKYTPAGGAVSFIAAEVAPTQSPLEVRSMLFEVTNTGPGIDQADLTTCFEKRSRGGRAHGIEGSGLGGYVLKSVAVAHHGEVIARSDINGLTSFSLFLPLDREIFAEEFFNR